MRRVCSPCVLLQFTPISRATALPQLFRSWSNQTALQYLAWQMGGNWGKANQVQEAIETQKCSTRLNLV